MIPPFGDPEYRLSYMLQGVATMHSELFENRQFTHKMHCRELPLAYNNKPVCALLNALESLTISDTAFLRHLNALPHRLLVNKWAAMILQSLPAGECRVGREL